MFTPSIVFLMILNTVAASAAPLFASQLSAFESRESLPPSTELAPDEAGVTRTGFDQEEMLAPAA
jgi:hypothetical protein